MSKTAIAMSLLLAANFTTIVIFLFVWEGGDYLNKKYVMSFNWHWPLGMLGFLVVGHTWYTMFKVIIRLDKEK